MKAIQGINLESTITLIGPNRPNCYEMKNKVFYHFTMYRCSSVQMTYCVTLSNP